VHEPEDDQSAKPEGVSLSTRHPLKQTVSGSTIDVARVISQSDENIQAGWRTITNQKHLSTFEKELQARREENLSWRIMGQQNRLKSPIDLDRKLPSLDPEEDIIAGVRTFLGGSAVSGSGPFDLVSAPSTGHPECWALAIHGGAGSITHLKSIPARLAAFEDILRNGTERLEAGESALDVATHITSLLEDCPFFNAGHGSVLTAQETFEMDAGVMDGCTMYGGGCAACTKVKNPVKLARAVCENTPHVLIAGPSADRLAVKYGLETADYEYFATEERVAQLHEAKRLNVVTLDHGGSLPECAPKSTSHGNNKDAPKMRAKLASEQKKKTNQTCDDYTGEHKFGTVGCVVKDVCGNLAAAGSTGGKHYSTCEHGLISMNPPALTYKHCPISTDI